MSKIMCKSVTSEMYFAFYPALLSHLPLRRAVSYPSFSSGRSLRTFPSFHFFTHYVGCNRRVTSSTLELRDYNSRYLHFLLLSRETAIDGQFSSCNITGIIRR